MNRDSNSPHPLPCVVQLGFAGSRRLFDEPPTDPEERSRLHAKIEACLVDALGRLPRELKLHPNHFLVGMSQIACGADTLFSRACLHAKPQTIPQRIVLPEHREAYLSAKSSEGEPDFSPAQRAEAEDLLKESHIIQERVVSHSATRSERFVDTNAEILRVSDVIVCLLRQDSVGKPGGTDELLERAKTRGTPVLEIRVGLNDGEPTFNEQWHNQNKFVLPHLPRELAHESVRIAVEPLPTRDEFCVPLRKLVSTQAEWHQKLFKFAAVMILATHILATICAASALALHDSGEEHEPVTFCHPGWIPVLLVVELILLAAGFFIHRHLHHSEAARRWAVARLVAELERSLRSIGPHHIYLEHLFRLSLPHRFRFLLRTLNALHLRSTWADRDADWKLRRNQYIFNRVDHQTGFYSTRLIQDERRLLLCQLAFTACSVFAMAATFGKLMLLTQTQVDDTSLATLGTLAIVLPVLAVGGLSWAAALDCEARIETFTETFDFLRRQRPLLEQATSRTEFDGLLLETETELLGETANWFSRRSNTGVT